MLKHLISISILYIGGGLAFDWPYVSILYEEVATIFPGMTRLALFMIILVILGLLSVFTKQSEQEKFFKQKSDYITTSLGILLWCLWWWKMPAVFEAWEFSNTDWPGSMWPEVVEWAKGMLISLIDIFQSLFTLQIISAIIGAIEFFFISWEFGLLVIGIQFFTQGYINLWSVYDTVGDFIDMIIEMLPL